MVTLAEDLTRINDTYQRNLKKTIKLVNMDFRDESIIVITTILEVFLRDMFRSCHHQWFHHKPNESIAMLPLNKRLLYRQQIKEYLESINAYDEYLKNYYLFQDYTDPETDCLNETLFGKYSKINFQNLTDTKGAKRAYKVFFGIDLVKLLDTEKTEQNKKWNKILEIIKERHEIIHNGKNTNFSVDTIHEIIEIIDKMRFDIFNQLMKAYNEN
jgi:hypothetical protein